MGSTGSALIDVDWPRFDPWRIQAVRHGLIDHPLLQPEALVRLARRLDASDGVRTHGIAATAGTPFADAPGLHPNRRSAEETLQRIRDAKSWLSLLNVQVDAEYRALVSEVLDPIRPNLEPRDPGMCYRAGWIFVSSPDAVTPFHMDVEHNFLLQLRGRKRVYVWDHRDTAVVSELARDRFHALHQRDLVTWDESFRTRAQVFELEPGMGAYMPSTSPHMVENGAEPSITMSFTYYTAATRRDRLLHRCHHWMRARGMRPAPVGARPMIDACTAVVGHAAFALGNLVQRARGQAALPDDVGFAHAQIGV